MILEALEYLSERGGAVALPSLDGSDPQHRHYWNPKSGKVETVEVFPSSRKSVAATLASFVEAVDTYKDLEHSGVIWVGLTLSGGNVVYVIDDSGHRHNRVTMPVVPSPVFKELHNSANNPKEQKPFLRFLRHNLKSAGGLKDLDLAASSVIWEKNQTEDGEVSTVKSTIGKRTTSEVRTKLGGPAIPDSVLVDFDPFPGIEAFNEIVQVECSVFVDTDANTFELTPVPGAIDAALSMALDQLAEFVRQNLKDPKPLVLCGTP